MRGYLDSDAQVHEVDGVTAAEPGFFRRLNQILGGLLEVVICCIQETEKESVIVIN